MSAFEKINNILVKYIGVVIIILSLIAFAKPAGFAWMTKYIALFLSVAMFGMGTTIDSRDFKNIILRPKEILIGCVLQYTVMPISAWCIAVLFKLNPDLALGMILVGCCPGGTASNVITHIADGDVALSVSMTIASTLIAPIMTPALVFLLAGRWVPVSFWGMFKSVLTVVLIPVLLGIGAKRLLGKHMQKVNSFLPALSSLSIVLIIAGIIAANAGKILASGLLVLLVVAIHNLIGLLCGLGAGKLLKLEHNKCTAVAIEVGMQNSGLAVSLANVNFSGNPLATLPGAVFSVWHNISGSVFAGIRRNQKEKIKAISTATGRDEGNA
ncbi:MAG: bile acid:sodium symporter family protein [Treponema sp.]